MVSDALAFVTSHMLARSMMLEGMEPSCLWWVDAIRAFVHDSVLRFCYGKNHSPIFVTTLKAVTQILRM